MKHFTLGINALLLSVVGISGLEAQTIKDIDGNVYPTITMGTQTWMKENLKVTHYSNGDPIETTKPGVYICEEETPKYQWPYGGKDSLVASCGRLYTWHVVADERNVCPTGWHVPSATEWTKLRQYLNLDTLSSITGNQKDTALYRKLAKVVTQSGFATVMGGQRTCGGAFFNPMARVWWSATNNDVRSKLWGLDPFIGMPLKTHYEENNGYAVRCIRD